MTRATQFHRRLAATALVVLSCLAVQHARAARPSAGIQAESPRIPQHYTLFDFGIAASGRPRIARAISNSGWVVGTFELDFLDTRGFAWKDSVYYNRLPLPGGFSSTVTDVNEAGVATGSALNADFLSRPCRWDNQTLPVDLEPGGQDFEEAFGLNNLGTVVGYGFTLDGELRGAVWQNGSKTLLPTLGGLTSQGNAINDAGQVVGSAERADGWTHACLWKNGVPTDLGTLGGLDSTAYAISPSGVIAGSATDENGFLRPVVWQEGLIQALPIEEGSEGEALGLNGLGHVVGEESDAQFISRAVRWIDGVAADLNSLIPSGTGWVLESASDINDRGQIVAAGTLDGEPRSCLLTPVAVDLSVAGTAPAPALVGRPVTVTLTVRNTGPSSSPESRLTVTLPSGTVLKAATPAYTLSGNQLNFELGALANGAARTATVTVEAAASGTMTLTAAVSGTEYDPDAEDDVSQVSVEVIEPQADLRIAQTASPETGVVDEPLTYTLTVRNDGPHAATAVSLTHQLPADVELVSTNPTAAREGDTLTFSLGDLPAQGTAGATVVIRSALARALISSASVSSPTSDPDPLDNTSQLSTTITPEPGPDLTGNWQTLYARCRGIGRGLRCNLSGRFRVRNAGTQAAGSSVLRLLFSQDAVADAQDTPVKALPVRALAAGEFVDVSLSGNLPRGVSPVGGYVLAVVDANNAVSEPVETNNVLEYGPMHGEPDLTGAWQEVAHLCRGAAGARRRCTVRGSLQVRNEGADSRTAFVVRLLLSADSTPDAGDRKLRDIRVRSLASGADRAIKFVSTLPQGIESSGQFVLAVIDAGTAVSERDEANNTASHGPLQ